MRFFKVMMVMAFVGALMVAPSGHATYWIVDFSIFEGENEDAQIGIVPPEPTEYWPIGDVPGTLTQGSSPWGPTALYEHGPGGDNARFFHSLNLADSWDIDNGVSVSWRIRFGPATPDGRNGIQINADGASGVGTNTYVALRHTDDTSFIEILRNGGGRYADLGDDDSDPRRILPFDIGVAEDEWLQFSVAIVSVPQEIDGRSDWAYWQLWLTGPNHEQELLLFDGGGGSPVHPDTGEQYSFRTWTDGGGKRLRIAQTDHSTVWDVEYDYISWTDEGAFYIDENEPVEMVEAPDFVGDGTLDEATVIAAIEDAGFTVGNINRQYNEDVPEGTVISQSPEPGSNIPEGSSIDLVISRGPAPTELPLAPITTGIIAAVLFATALKVRRMRVSA